MAFPKYTRRLFRYALLGVLLFTATSGAYPQLRIYRQQSIRSDILENEVWFSVMLPANYPIERKAYPVVYLLHGFGGDHTSWIDRCTIHQLLDSLEKEHLTDACIYVLPDAGKSYYINSYNGTFNYADFFIRELVPHIDSLYRTIPDRKYRALLGLSMGGFGSMVLAAKYPGTFGTAVALSAAVRNESHFMALPQSRYERYFAQVYGPGLEGEERITAHWKNNSPYYLIDSVTAPRYSTVNWYIDCGFHDFLLPANEAFHRHLTEYAISHEYHVRPGRHDWEYWYRAGTGGFIYIHEKFRQAKSNP